MFEGEAGPEELKARLDALQEREKGAADALLEGGTGAAGATTPWSA
jgi:hypothetical protein